MSRIGKTLKMHRLRVGLTQDQLGKLVDYSAAMISQIEDGLKSPSLEKAQDLAIQLGISLSALVGETVPLHTVTNHSSGDHAVIQNIDGHYCALHQETLAALRAEMQEVHTRLDALTRQLARWLPPEPVGHLPVPGSA